jgi:uncharacterized protein with LGFP repeats
MSSRPLPSLSAALALGGLVLAAGGAWAQDATPPAPTTPAPPADAAPKACGFDMDAAAMKLWAAFGGEGGALGCPTADEAAAATSARGVESSQVVFGDRGAIYVYRSGPMAGQAVAITNCYPLYFQYGGASGWLGLPLDNAVNTPDGQVQRFDGGEMRFGRALQSCDASAGADGP